MMYCFLGALQEHDGFFYNALQILFTHENCSAS